MASVFAVSVVPGYSIVAPVIAENVDHQFHKTTSFAHHVEQRFLILKEPRPRGTRKKKLQKAKNGHTIQIVVSKKSNAQGNGKRALTLQMF